MSNDKLAQEALDQIMEQAQVFASAWSLVGGPFDSGSALDDANDAKDELRTMVRSLATLAAEAEKQAGPVASDNEDAERYRQWFETVQDLNGAYLNDSDYKLAASLYKSLGMRVPNSVAARANR